MCPCVLMTKFDARKIPALEWLACKLEDMVHSLGLCPNWTCCSYPTDVHQPYTNTNTTYRATGVRQTLLVQSHLLRTGTQPIPVEVGPIPLNSEWVWNSESEWSGESHLTIQGSFIFDFKILSLNRSLFPASAIHSYMLYRCRWLYLSKW